MRFVMRVESRLQLGRDVPYWPGVYLLKNEVTGDTYVGSSRNMRIRMQGHWTAAQRGTGCPRLSESVQVHGWGAFTFSVLQEVKMTADDWRTTCRRNALLGNAELKWMRKLLPTLNCVGRRRVRMI